MITTSYEKKYTNEELNEFGKLVRRQYELKGFPTQNAFADFADIQPILVGRLLRSIADRTSFSGVVEFCLALDIDIYEVIKILHLDATVKERMKDPKYAGYFKNLSWMKDCDSPAAGPLEELLKSVPEDRRELGRRMIEQTLDTLRR